MSNRTFPSALPAMLWLRSSRSPSTGGIPAKLKHFPPLPEYFEFEMFFIFLPIHSLFSYHHVPEPHFHTEPCTIIFYGQCTHRVQNSFLDMLLCIYVTIIFILIQHSDIHTGTHVTQTQRIPVQFLRQITSVFQKFLFIV